MFRTFARRCSGTLQRHGRRRLWQWGSSSEANGFTELPRILDSVFGVEAAACGTDHCAYVVDGVLHTFGSNADGQLGREVVDESPAAVRFPAGEDTTLKVVWVSLGKRHSAAITQGGLLWTWGWGGSFWYGAGALGHGTRDPHLHPMPVEKLVDLGQAATQVACSNSHTLVLTDSGRLYVTGNGNYGKLAQGPDLEDSLDFVEVQYFTHSYDSVKEPEQRMKIKKIDCGRNFSGVLAHTGELWVWGQNDYGQLGFGEEAKYNSESCEKYPRLMRSLALEGQTVRDFACGENHIVAVMDSGAIYEWGNRLYWEPQMISLPSRYENAIKGVVKVAAGDRFSAALTADGRLRTWGDRSSGCLMLGDSDQDRVAEPTLVDQELFQNQRVIDVEFNKQRCLAVTQEVA
eukprot:gnl/MRDRNA2_/MRDRNA2_56153_c0_seq1.p1 gnl/MRDRNA2_/MRDRNA2_56153_c0~~gnl/MRDRNA2_/MRDRNA2_56153_c0_seq1.p1  ORF type:complete len:403 (+),score=78.50 gnl/MRDRNA2_/MRDRNA2_56153_c0_seq1:68-1276(+)